MKWSAFALVLSLPAAGVSQTIVYPSLKSAAATVLKKVPPNALTPPGNPGLPPKTPERLPAPGEKDDGFRVVRSGDVHGIGDEVHVIGGAELLIRGYRVFANSARGNRKTEVWELDGNVSVIGQGSVVHGERVIVDFKNRTYRAFDSESQLDPKFLNNQNLQDRVYVAGRESYGSEKELKAYGSDLTTCNYDHPHFDIRGSETIVRPGAYAIIRKAQIRIFGRSIVTVPYLYIPLKDQNYKYTPDVGQSRDEGYYVKNRYGIPMKAGRILDSRLDYMSKLGTGFGAGYAYKSAKTDGEFKAYQITGQTDTLNMSNRHEQRFKWGKLSLSNDLQRNNYLSAPGTTLLQNRLSLDLPSSRGNTRLGYNRTNNTATSYQSTNQTITFANDQRWGGKFSTKLNVNYSQTGSRGYSTSNKREQIDVLLTGTQEMQRATATMEYQRSIPIGDTSNFYSGSDRTPVLTLASDAKRLFGDSADRSLPFKTSLSIGEFQNTTTESPVTRTAFDFNFQKYDKSQSRFKTDVTGQFKQGVYSDDTAQYTLNFGSTSTYRTGKNTSVNFRYNYLRPYGYTPLVVDRSGKTNQATIDASGTVLHSLKLGLQTGYDINQLNEGETPWQQVGVRTDWQPRRWFMLRALSNYDSINQYWSSVRLDLTYLPGATSLTIGTRFDGLRHTWGSLNLVLNNLKIGRTRLSTVFQYNGYTKQFDSRQYNVIYDLHCAEAIFNVTENNTGFRAGREIQFLIRLKAFPFFTPFGSGSRGQPIGSGTGRDF